MLGDISIDPLSHLELAAEFENGIRIFEIEQVKQQMETHHIIKKRIPKPGCYPKNFSQYSMQKISCTLTLGELHHDLRALSGTSDALKVGRNSIVGSDIYSPFDKIKLREDVDCRRKVTKAYGKFIDFEELPKPKKKRTRVSKKPSYNLRRHHNVTKHIHVFE